MPSLGQDRLTMLDIVRERNPDGSLATVAEVLHQTSTVIQDAPMYESNAPTGNRVTFRSSLPTVGFSKVNQGYVRSKGSTEQRTDSIGLIAGLSEVDSKLKRIVGAAAFDNARWLEDQGFLEAYSQLINSTVFYGDEGINDAAFTGLRPRLNTLSSAITGPQVYSQAAAANRGSIYVIDWGERGCHLIYPPGTTAGLDARDKGEQRVTDADGNPMMAYVTAYDAAVGLTVKDPRHIGRLAQIEAVSSQLDTAFEMVLGASGEGGLMDILGAMPAQNGMMRAAYVPQRLYVAFMKQAVNKSNANLRMEDYLNQKIPYFWDVAIRRVDQLSIAESALV